MSIHEKFKSILETNAFDELISFKEPKSWKAMTLEERELLGILFVKQGELQFLEADSRALESFELSLKVASHSSLIYFKQALVYSTQEHNIRCLKAADKALKKAIQLSPAFVNAWYTWGNVLVRIGIFYEDAAYFQLADEKFSEAEKFAKESGETVDHLYWHWGLSWFHLGKVSGEAIDFFRSLEKFHLAREQGVDHAEFHRDFGNTIVDLAMLIGKEELLLEAVEHYEKAVFLAPLSYEYRLNLACTYQRLFEFSYSRDYLHKADECFEYASNLQQECAVVWQSWGELYVLAGKIFRDPHSIHEGLEKFKKSEQLDPGNPFNLLRWSEALIYVASINENLDFLRDAESKIGFVLKALPRDSEAWYVYGLCLLELGHYFSSEEHYFRAIEKFKQGLELSSASFLLLHGIALAYFAIGEVKHRVVPLEQSIEYFVLADKKSERQYPQFLNDWGVALMKMGEMLGNRTFVEEAVVKFEKAINTRLDLFDGEEMELEWLYNYGCAMDFLGDFYDEAAYYEKAVHVLSHVLKLEPDYYYAKYNLALALTHLGELNSDVECLHQSLELFQEMLDHEPEDEVVWNDYGLALLNLATLTAEPINLDKAKILFDQAELKLLQASALGSLPAYYNLACLYALTENSVTALHYLEKAEQNHALPFFDDVIQDEWLDNLRDQPGYRLFISRLINKRDEDQI